MCTSGTDFGYKCSRTGEELATHWDSTSVRGVEIACALTEGDGVDVAPLTNDSEDHVCPCVVVAGKCWASASGVGSTGREPVNDSTSGGHEA